MYYLSLFRGWRELCASVILLAALATGASGASATSTGPADVVLYAADAANLHGNWARVADTTAAGQQLLSSGDQGWASTGTTFAAPADYFELTFPAGANTPYHVWVRQRATANSKFNDSVYLQFS